MRLDVHFMTYTLIGVMKLTGGNHYILLCFQRKMEVKKEKMEYVEQEARYIDGFNEEDDDDKKPLFSFDDILKEEGAPGWAIAVSQIKVTLTTFLYLRTSIFLFCCKLEISYLDFIWHTSWPLTFFTAVST